MADGDSTEWDQRLKPVEGMVEVIEVGSDDEDIVARSHSRRNSSKRDASNDEDSISPDPGQEETVDDGEIVVVNGDEQASDEDDGDDDSQWSMYEDIIEGTLETDDSSPPVPDNRADYVTQEEGVQFRSRLRSIGEKAFIEETIGAGTITAKKLCTAFGIRLPFWLEGAPDVTYRGLLFAAISRELSKRVKLPQYNTIDDAVGLLQRSKNIVVLTGAGISTSLGIPDFRSKETGLYSQLEHLGLSDPQEVFEIGLFHEDPKVFYSVAKDILPSKRRFSPTHAFIRLLQDKRKLLTNYTQNIDNLEQHAGIREDNLVQCHGSFATATCIECKHKVDGEVIFDDIKAGRVPYCERCTQNLNAIGPGLKRKRSSDGKSKPRKRKSSWEDSSDEDDEDIPLAGAMKPDITFFGESLPATFRNRLVDHDRSVVDLVIVIGTSLKVAPVSEVVGIVPTEIPQIYISREPCSHVDFDIDLLGDCDAIVTELCRRAGWDFEHEMIRDEEIEVRLQEGYESRYSIKHVEA